jgi:hypothetical protein
VYVRKWMEHRTTIDTRKAGHAAARRNNNCGGV